MTRRKQIVTIVESCIYCSWMLPGDPDLLCTENPDQEPRIINDPDEIPAWCRLDDAGGRERRKSMKPLYARLHELSRRSKWSDFVDLFTRATKDGKDFYYATVHMDIISDIAPWAYDKLKDGETVELWIAEKRPLED